MQITDEMLVAFADGELLPGEAATVQAAILDDPTLANRVEQMRAVRAALRSGVGGAEVPDALTARIRALAAERASTLSVEAPVIDLAARRRASPVRPVWQLPTAAAIALAIGAAAGWMVRTGPVPVDGLVFAGLDDGAVARLLDTLPSGTGAGIGSDETLTVISSFTDSSGILCREFEIDSASTARLAVACVEGPSWDLRFVAATSPDGDGYLPASSTEALDVWLDAIGAGGVLEPDEEAAALRALR